MRSKLKTIAVRVSTSMTTILAILCTLVLMMLTGCGEAELLPTPVPINDAPALSEQARSGQTLFNTVGACNSCHTVNGVGGLIGPDLVGVADRMRIAHPDLSAEEGLELEIVDPIEHVTENYRGDLMPFNYADTLTDEQIKEIVAYLISLG